MANAGFVRNLRLLSSAKDAWVRLNDSYLNIATGGGAFPKGATPKKAARAWPLSESTEGTQNADNFVYCSPDYTHLRKVLRVLSPSSSDVVYDIGSGKGR